MKHRPLFGGALGRLTPNAAGGAWMIASAVFYTMHMSLAKLTAGAYPPPVVALVNALVALAALSPMVLRAGASAWRVSQPGLLFMRSAMGASGIILTFYAIRDMPLSQFNAISFSRTIFVVVLAALLLREQVGVRRWAATAVGFAGVLIIVRPSGDASAATWMSLASAVLFAGTVVLVKTLSARHSALTLLLYANVLNAVLVAIPAVLVWKTPQLADLPLLVGVALSGAVGQYSYIRGMALGDASLMSNLDYLRLPMLLAADWVVFQLLPSPWIWPGVALIVASTVYISLREAALARAGRLSRPPSAPSADPPPPD